MVPLPIQQNFRGPLFDNAAAVRDIRIKAQGVQTAAHFITGNGGGVQLAQFQKP